MSEQPHLIPSAPHGGVDASALPENGFDQHAVSWWGTVAFMIIEGTSLVVCLSTYIYLRRNFDGYPPHGLFEPAILVPTINVLLMLTSMLVATRLKKAATAYDRTALIRAAAVLVAFELVILVIRAFEFDALNVRWDSNAYGSAAWFTLGFHTLLLFIDFAESVAILAIFVLGRQEKKHFTDAADDAFYWNFVVLAWIPIYAIIFLGPRLL